MTHFHEIFQIDIEISFLRSDHDILDRQGGRGAVGCVEFEDGERGAVAENTEILFPEMTIFYQVGADGRQPETRFHIVKMSRNLNR